MSKEKHPNDEILKRINSLSSIEKLVFDTITNGKAHPDDIQAIARICKLSDLQAGVALQLLKHKKLIL
ncbi:hypothetical protein [Paenibacillus alginolyticus]|uniref:MarR family transcriptional regulator n=1 Tax=Paenibacillus alginolyticus TaxID=59839 RepID=A0ABT4GDA6_9BACL|nr:hypothetical protein [Paenibacillus alginolyticus]MCY9694177.1 hypothetical protein [Paenibacillus alginolyticus]MEC0142727.1 hypothetical protein [Paenibacillus alginolyticus]